ncbi:hypothetical protein WR25_07308 [Diploscapter pachys]|uniref:Uncharacterized protein n=1 Tax=Diploscapter pachys TaxID=2018661 RepID=A0A2A2LIV1_9BILA|nr:hypothetical protein WR25_07308 [Diploscapter pachys]
MQIKRTVREPQTVTISCTVASVSGHKPIVGFSDEVEKAWRSLVRKYKLKSRAPLERVESMDLIIEETEKEKQIINEKKFAVSKNNTKIVSDINVFIHIQKRDEFGFEAQRG